LPIGTCPWNSIIHGTITANRIFLGTGTVVDNCVANEIVGAKGACTTSTVGPGSFNPPAACLSAFPPPPLAAPNVPDCVSTGNDVTVPAGATRTCLAAATGLFG
jgi:hypothetical protein